MSDTTAPMSGTQDLIDSPEANADRASTRSLWLKRLAVAVAGLAVLWGIWYLVFERGKVSTDDAYVGADLAQVTPLLSASVVSVNVADTQFVHAGTVLLRLDPSDAQIRLEQAQADLATARRHFREASANNTALSAQVSAHAAAVTAAEAQLSAATASADKARVDLERRAAVAPGGGVSGDELTAARSANANAQAALASARAAVAKARAEQAAAGGDLAANEALIHGLSEDTDPGVIAAKSKLDSAQLDIERTVIRAPIDGVVTRRQVQVGQRVAQGVAVMEIVPMSSLFVDANFKERQLSDVRAGQPADVTADLYGSSVTYHGKVVGVGGATGAATSIIPAQNATGNWIKVVQRLPVRIALDPRELADHPLRVGLSAEVTIDVSGSGN